jgi:hypothetical protein
VCSERMRNPKAAIANYSKFVSLWSEADEQIPQVHEARTRLAALNASQP